MSKSSRTPFILVDGSSYLYRAFHALPPLTTADGRPTGAIRGVAAMLRKLMSEYQPERMAVVFDAPGKTFRDDLYADYKANRPPMPDDLRAQIEPLHALVRAMGLPLICEPGVEADDVIGTLAVQAAEAGDYVIISTGDKDMAQLVTDQVHLLDTMKDTLTDIDGVKAKFGVTPQQIIDYLALIGDKVDNVPGVDKVGPKTAVKWLESYHSLDGVLDNAEQIGGKIGENLREAAARLPLSRELVTIKLDVPLTQTPAVLAVQPADAPQLRTLFADLGFKSWLAELDDQSGGETVPEAEAVEARYETILTDAQLEAWLTRLEAAPYFALDTETTSLNYMDAELVGLSFSVEPGVAAYLPVAHDYDGAPVQLGREQVLTRLRPLLENDSITKLGHNLKYDQSVLANHGIALRGVHHDTMLESYVLNSTASRHNLDDVAEQQLGYKTTHYEDVAGKGAKQVTFNKVSLEAATPYAAEDADISLRLHQLFAPQLAQQPGLQSLYSEVEIPLLGVLSRMERTGVYVDPDELFTMSNELAGRMQQLEQAAFAAAGKEFNLGSPKQLQEILFTEQGIPVIRKTPKGQPSTAEDVLQELADTGYELPRLIMDHRSMSKLKSTYTDKLPMQINAKTGRIHTSYHQAVASTGRLSSSEPNLQNIPVRTAEGRRIRQAFRAPEGQLIVAADYSQIELRIMAHLSGDEGLLSAFQDDRDIHAATAAEVFGGDPASVDPDKRRAAKAINFGLIYGMSAFGLAKQLNIGRKDAQDYVDLYFERYPGVRRYMDETRELAREQGYVETVFGRRLYLPEIKSRNVQRRNYAERTAINAPMQGTAADIIKKAMISVDQWLQHEQPPLKMIMQVHDELVFEVEAASLEPVTERIREAMESVAELKVPLRVEVGHGSNWDEAH